MSERMAWMVLLMLCLISRLWSAIYYIEDPDSLRFALALSDYDVAKMQPHFPAYPVFCVFAKIIYWITGRYAVAFAMLGGLATFATIYFSLALAHKRIVEPIGIALALLLFFNPLVWLMGNRYMPDLTGVALALASCAFAGAHSAKKVLVGHFVAGLMLGVRLSYAPILLPPLWAALRATNERTLLVGAGLAGVVVWLLPLIAITGWDDLVAAAREQTTGHFTEFGGTFATEPDYVQRAVKLFEGLWADGFGLYWPGRHWVTLVAAIALLGTLYVIGRDFSLRSVSWPRALWWGGMLYLVWIFFFQNVVYKSRHVLPLLPFLAIALAYALGKIGCSGRRLVQALAFCFVLCYSYATLHLVVQHRQGSAIAQVHRYLLSRETADLRVASVPLIKYYLAAQGLKAEYLPIATSGDLVQLQSLVDSTQLTVIGSPLANRKPVLAKTFYHNPYVNRMWPELTVYEY